MPGVKPPFVLPEALRNAYAINHRINRFLIEGLDEAVWHKKNPDGKGRTIAAMVAHMHNVRVMWLKSVKAAAIPEPLEKENLTRQQAIAGLQASSAALDEVLSGALVGDGQVRGFKPDAAAFLGYLIAHDAHHRGQITYQARLLGHPVSRQVMFGLWEWGTR